MIESNTIWLNYIKKEPLTGSYQGMRYRLEKADELLVTIWPEPYNYIKTADSLKQKKLFPLTEEGKEQAVLWLNEQYETQKPLWQSTNLSFCRP